MRLILTPILIIAYSKLAFATRMRCRDHPLCRDGMKGEMIKAWMYAPRRNRMYWTLATYIPRNTRYNFVPHDEPGSKKYIGLDYFLTGFNGEMQREYLKMYYQRRTKTYLLVHDRLKLPARLKGWRSEGWVTRNSGQPYLKHNFGLGQPKGEIPVAHHAYVFSKIGESVTVPSNAYIKRNI